MHHFALLLGYGAGAINPYLAFETIRDLCREGVLVGPDRAQGRQELRQGRRQGHPQGDVEDGHLDRRIATPARRSSRRSASAGVRRRVLHRTASRIDGIGLDVIAREVAARHAHRVPRPARGARAPRARRSAASTSGAANGEYHLFNPDTVYKLQHSTPHRPLRRLQGVHAARRRPVEAARDAARAVRARRPARAAGPDRRGRAGRGDREAVHDRRDVATARSARRRTRRSRSR